MNKIKRGVPNFDAYDKIDCPTCKWERLNLNKHGCTGWCIGCYNYKKGKESIYAGSCPCDFPNTKNDREAVPEHCIYYRNQEIQTVKVFDIRKCYYEDELRQIVKDDKFFSGKNHHWALRFHKCLQEEIENAGFLCNNSWLKEVEPEEVRTEAANIADLDGGAFKWSWL